MLNGENVLDTLPSGLSCCSAVGCEFSVNLSTNTLTKVSLTRSTHKTRDYQLCPAFPAGAMVQCSLRVHGDFMEQNCRQ